MSLEQDLLAMETQFWTGGPEAFQRHSDDNCLVVFTEMAGVMAKADIAKTAEKGRWTRRPAGAEGHGKTVRRFRHHLL